MGQMIEGYVWFLFFIQSLAMFYFLTFFLNPRFHVFLSYVIWYAAHLIWRILINKVENIDNVWLLSGQLLFILILIMVVFKGYNLKYLAGVYTGFICIINGGSVLAAALAATITHGNVYLDHNMSVYDQNYLIATPLCNLFYVILFETFIVWKRRKEHKNIGGGGVVIVMNIYQIFLIVFMFICYKQMTRAGIINSLLIVVFSCIIDVILIIYIDAVPRKIRAEKEYQMLKQLRQQEYDHYRKQKNMVEQFRILRHEYVNYLDIIQNMIENQADAERIKQQIDKCLERTL